MKKRIISTMLSMFALMGVSVIVSSSASAAISRKCGDNLTWAIDDAGILTVSGTGDMDYWEMEDGVDPPWDKYDKLIKKVVIENGVTYISNGAFCDCENLTSVDIPESVTDIGYGAFLNCKNLTSIDIPDSVVEIGERAFLGCEKLTSIDISDGVTNIGYGMVTRTAYCNDESNWENGVLYIGDCLVETKEDIADSNCIKPGTCAIADSAFMGCHNLTSITIPVSVTSIDDNAFNMCYGLESINVDGGNKNYSSADGVLFNKDRTELLLYPAVKTGTHYTVLDGVTIIGEEAFFAPVN